MSEVTYEQSLEVLLLQAGANGRAEALLGGCAGRALEAAAPFLIGDAFPEVYLEFPLAGEPFLDLTVVYGELQQGARVGSPLAAGMEATTPTTTATSRTTWQSASRPSRRASRRRPVKQKAALATFPFPRGAARTTRRARRRSRTERLPRLGSLS